MTPQEAARELEAIRAHRSDARKERYRRSKLRRYRNELVALHRMGANYQELAFWLKREHRLRADPSTIRRYLAQLPELADDKGNNDAELPQG